MAEKKRVGSVAESGERKDTTRHSKEEGHASGRTSVLAPKRNPLESPFKRSNQKVRGP